MRPWMLTTSLLTMTLRMPAGDFHIASDVAIKPESHTPKRRDDFPGEDMDVTMRPPANGVSASAAAGRFKFIVTPSSPKGVKRTLPPGTSQSRRCAVA